MGHNLPSLIVILGPTASGKTELAIRLAKEFHGFIISADSRQVYRHMDIGTAKPTPEQLRAVHHEMIDIVEPDEPFSLADYQKRVFTCLETGYQSKIPFLVGGTGLYIDAVVENWNIPKVAPNKQLRQDLEKQPFNLSVERLRQLDPDSAAGIDLNNTRRVIRALEVALATGRSFTAQRLKRPFPYRVLMLGLDVPRQELVQRIDHRVDQMMSDGLLEEVRNLSKKFDWDLPSMSGIGYRQLGAYLRNEMTLEQSVEQIKIATRQYAKRQMTWFRRNKSIHWIRRAPEAEKLVADFLHVH